MKCFCGEPWERFEDVCSLRAFRDGISGGLIDRNGGGHAYRGIVTAKFITKLV